jgi:hypothetical protein
MENASKPLESQKQVNPCFYFARPQGAYDGTALNGRGLSWLKPVIYPYHHFKNVT